MTEPILEIRNLNKSFGALKATDGVSLSLMPGEIVLGFDLPKPEAPLRWGFAKVAPKSGAFATSIAIASPRDVLLSNPFDLGGGGPRLFASHDGGRNWTTVITEAPAVVHSAAPGDSDLLGFSGVSSGYWVGGGQTIWTTPDRGRTWTMNPGPGG